ncbi:hypothetical protein KC207_15810 [Phycicoccus sp. BSK3Z-2]|uniref:DUF1700 domain-containing protein n=1 Tax=Phycicoccus avicenniae TaxID=2828860 RepID=A0A941DA25_9MICO|nr:hypothetical protein [Phycicoccus avicenniae]MBR7744763.1 hypothetical protein [Phycicoccus avicenniae]
MTAAIDHPLAAAYLRDLELMLHGLDPLSRTEVLEGVREHLAAALGPEPSGEQVRAVLADLGPPASIADEAYADRPPRTVAPAEPARWPAVVASTLNGIGLLLFVPLLFVRATSPSELLLGIPVLLLPWVVIAVLSAMGAVWTTRQKATSAALGPTTLVAVVLLTQAFFVVLGPSPVTWLPVAVVLGASGTILYRLSRRALRGPEGRPSPSLVTDDVARPRP